MEDTRTHLLVWVREGITQISLLLISVLTRLLGEILKHSLAEEAGLMASIRGARVGTRAGHRDNPLEPCWLSGRRQLLECQASIILSILIHER